MRNSNSLCSAYIIDPFPDRMISYILPIVARSRGDNRDNWLQLCHNLSNQIISVLATKLRTVSGKVHPPRVRFEPVSVSKCMCLCVCLMRGNLRYPQHAVNSAKRDQLVAEVARLRTRVRDEFLLKTCLSGKLVRTVIAFHSPTLHSSMERAFNVHDTHCLQSWQPAWKRQDAVGILRSLCDAALPELTWANWQLLEPIVSDLAKHVRRSLLPKPMGGEWGLAGSSLCECVCFCEFGE